MIDTDVDPSLVLGDVIDAIGDRFAELFVFEVMHRFAALTPREFEIFTLIGRGLSNGEIASTLTLSQATVKTHVKRVPSKLDLRDRIHAVVLAYETGIVTPGTSDPDAR